MSTFGTLLDGNEFQQHNEPNMFQDRRWFKIKANIWPFSGEDDCNLAFQ